jgi:alcohol dehydrogenase
VRAAIFEGPDLWYYRGETPHAAGSVGHEFIGIVEQAGADLRNVQPGDLVVAPFIYSDMSCPHCPNGSTMDERRAIKSLVRVGAA